MGSGASKGEAFTKKWKEGAKLGEGTFGTVRKATKVNRKDTDLTSFPFEVAVKTVDESVQPKDEIELLNECLRVEKPVLGICRGLQLINVALGGTLYQDLETQCPESQVHRDWNVYEDLHHEVVFEPGSRLHEFYPGKSGGRVNSIHHQAVMDLAEGLVIEARSVDDGIVEALHRPGPSYLYALQWHPEFIPAEAAELLSPDPIMGSFLSAAEEART